MRRRDRAPSRLTLAMMLALVIGCGGSGSGVGSDAGGGRDGAGDDGAVIPIDAKVEIDAAPPAIDANLEPPPPPLLGAQLHRAGRPAIKTMLLGAFDAPGVQASLQDVYDRASDPAAWVTLMLPNGVTLEREFATNLAILDAFDKGRAGIPSAGCGTTLHYSGPASPTSYLFAADLFADDQLYIDTAQSTCDLYFALELFRVSPETQPVTTCGGRMPTHDVVDVTYSVLAAGTFGLSGRVPNFHDNVAAHADVSTTFPFLGAPH